jgi:hypothetical protein
MAGLADTLLSSLDARSVQSISRQLGLNPQQTAGAIQAALPMLLGQMAKNASRPEGANALFGAVQRDHTGIDVGGLLGGLLGSLGGGQAQPAQNSGLAGGMAILGHVFGGGQSSGAAQIPKVQGLDSAGSAKLLAMLAPLVMAALGKMTQGGQLDGGAISGLLGGESQRIAQAPPSLLGGLMGAALDSDGDGKMDVGGVLKSAQTLGSLFGKR